MKKYTVVLKYDVYANSSRAAAKMVLKLMRDKDAIIPEMDVQFDIGYALINLNTEDDKNDSL